MFKPSRIRTTVHTDSHDLQLFNAVADDDGHNNAIGGFGVRL
jgi:hypothetical protein